MIRADGWGPRIGRGAADLAGRSGRVGPPMGASGQSREAKAGVVSPPTFSPVTR